MARLAAGRARVELGGADVAAIMLRHGWPTIVIHGEHGAGTGRLLTTIKKERR